MIETFFSGKRETMFKLIALHLTLSQTSHWNLLVATVVLVVLWHPLSANILILMLRS